MKSITDRNKRKVSELFNEATQRQKGDKNCSN